MHESLQNTQQRCSRDVPAVVFHTKETRAGPAEELPGVAATRGAPVIVFILLVVVAGGVHGASGVVGEARCARRVVRG